MRPIRGWLRRAGGSTGGRLPILPERRVRLDRRPRIPSEIGPFLPRSAFSTAIRGVRRALGGAGRGANGAIEECERHREAHGVVVRDAQPAPDPGLARRRGVEREDEPERERDRDGPRDAHREAAHGRGSPRRGRRARFVVQPIAARGRSSERRSAGGARGRTGHAHRTRAADAGHRIFDRRSRPLRSLFARRPRKGLARICPRLAIPP